MMFLVTLILSMTYSRIASHVYDAHNIVYPWDFPGCWNGSKLKSMNSNDMTIPFDRIVVIGDIHGNWNGMMRILHNAGIVSGIDECSWKVSSPVSAILLIQTGDVVDRGQASLKCFECLNKLQQTAQYYSSKVVRLMGNHELLWLSGEIEYRNKDYDSIESINKVTRAIMEDVVNGDISGSYYYEGYHNLPLLFSHAGIRKTLKDYLLNAMTTSDGVSEDQSMNRNIRISNYINDIIVNSIQACLSNNRDKIINQDSNTNILITNCRQYFNHPIYSASSERGGDGLGGIFWIDYEILRQDALQMTEHDYIQIVGHTYSVNNIRSTQMLSHICIDVGIMYGGRGYLEIQRNGRIYKNIHANQEWKITDMTSIYC
jgi:hypothetical protein